MRSPVQEPPLRLRYESPINASPSRFRDHPRPFDYEEPELDRQSAHRSSLGRSIGTLPSYNGTFLDSFHFLGFISLDVLMCTGFGISVFQVFYQCLWLDWILYRYFDVFLSFFFFFYIFIFIFIFLARYERNQKKKPIVVSSRSPPRPGYTLKSSTLPVNGRQSGADYLVNH